MKVLFVVNIPSPYRVAFFSELGKMCELTVLYERRTASNREAKWYSNDSIKSFEEIFLNGINLGTDLALSLEIVEYLKKDFDVIVLGMYSSPTEQLAITYLKLHSIPFILSTDGGFVGNDSRIKRWIKTKLIGSAQFWLSTGKYADDYLEYYGARRKDIRRYPFTSLYEEDVQRKVLSVDKKSELRRELEILKKINIICVCRFVPGKGLETLLAAMRILLSRADINLILIGGTVAELEKLIDGEIPKNVMTIGFLEKKKLFEYYKASDLFVLPTESDVWGLVVNEAMANGLPVISTTKCGAALELVQTNVNGAVIEPNDSELLATTILKYVDGDLTIMGEESINIISKYTYRQMAKAHIAAFESTLKV